MNNISFIIYMEINQDILGIIISIIWGLGLACLFRKVCDNNNCIVVKYPENLDEYFIKKKGKCYNFIRENCDLN